jgi:hypothetical protein
VPAALRDPGGGRQCGWCGSLDDGQGRAALGYSARNAGSWMRRKATTPVTPWDRGVTASASAHESDPPQKRPEDAPAPTVGVAPHDSAHPAVATSPPVLVRLALVPAPAQRCPRPRRRRSRRGRPVGLGRPARRPRRWTRRRRADRQSRRWRQDGRDALSAATSRPSTVRRRRGVAHHTFLPFGAEFPSSCPSRPATPRGEDRHPMSCNRNPRRHALPPNRTPAESAAAGVPGQRVGSMCRTS